MNNISLLPVGSTKLERKLSHTLSAIADIPVPLNLLLHAKHCPADLLPWLAWSVSVDEWDDNWSDEQKRNSILDSIHIHKTKGTVASIRRVLASAGYGDVVILENMSAIFYNGENTFNGDYVYGSAESHWATYRVYLKKPISIEQAEQVRLLLANTAPARCHLLGLHFEQANNLYNNKITYSGEYSYGVA
ncbi:phage tail protein I [Basfia succiniciproducens]|uniref:phage tail protein I n=1 Tax=Basfia succiniciproducens TaxID=653940 RepID=UPI003FCE902B